MTRLTPLGKIVILAVVIEVLAALLLISALSARPGTSSAYPPLDEDGAQVALVPGAPSFPDGNAGERKPGTSVDGSSVPLAAANADHYPLEGAPQATRITGDANQATLSHGRDYLAMRLTRGTVVTICGAGGCWENARVNDYGPKKSTGDIADIGIVHWRHVCGLPDYRGECEVVVTIQSRPKIRLPATDAS